MSIEEQTRDRPDDQYDEEQLRMGVAIEMEHTNDSEIAKKIAKDHLDEMPDYYTRLKAMERSAGELSGQQLPIKDFTKIAEDFLDPLSKLFAGGMDEKAGKILLAIDKSSGAVFRMIFEALAKVYGASRIEASIHAASPGLSGSESSNPNDLFTAVLGQPGEAWTGGYWSVKFNPTGILMRRLTESEAKREASEKNALFSNERARAHRFAGSEIGNYHADGTLMELHKILSVAEDPPGYKAGTLMALLDDGTHSVGDEAALSRQIEAVKDARHEGTVFRRDVRVGDWMRAVPVGETEAIEGTVVHGDTDKYGRQIYVVEYVKAGKTITVEIPIDRVKDWKPKGEASVAEKKWDFFDPLGNLVLTERMTEEQAQDHAHKMGWNFAPHDPQWHDIPKEALIEELVRIKSRTTPMVDKQFIRNKLERKSLEELREQMKRYEEEYPISPRLNDDVSFTVFQNEKHPLTVSAKDWTIKDALQDMGYPMDISPEIIDRNLSEEAEHFLHKLEEHSGLDKIAVTALPDNPYVESNPEWWDIRNGQRALKDSSYTEYLAKATLGKVVGLGEGLGASGKIQTFTEGEFRKWVRAEGLTKDARPQTGIYKNGKRIGSYFERSGMIEVELYTGTATKAQVHADAIRQRLLTLSRHAKSQTESFTVEEIGIAARDEGSWINWKHMVIGGKDALMNSATGIGRDVQALVHMVRPEGASARSYSGRETPYRWIKWDESIAKGILELGEEGIEQTQKAVHRLKEFEVPTTLKDSITDLSLTTRTVEIKWGLLTQAYREFVQGSSGKEIGKTNAEVEEKVMLFHLKHAMSDLDTASGILSPLLHTSQEASRMNVLLGLEHDLEMWVEHLGDYVRKLEE